MRVEGAIVDLFLVKTARPTIGPKAGLLPFPVLLAKLNKIEILQYKRAEKRRLGVSPPAGGPPPFQAAAAAATTGLTSPLLHSSPLLAAAASPCNYDRSASPRP